MYLIIVVAENIPNVVQLFFKSLDYNLNRFS